MDLLESFDLPCAHSMAVHWIFNQTAASEFSELFTTAVLTNFHPNCKTEERVSFFYLPCQNNLSSITLCKNKKINQSCTSIWKKKKNPVQVFRESWQDKTKSYQKAAKKTEECSTVIYFFLLLFFYFYFFLLLINKSQDFLARYRFSYTSMHFCTDPTEELYDKFEIFFPQKITDLRR